MSVTKVNLDLRQEGEALLVEQTGGEVLFSQADQMRSKPAVLWMTNLVPTKNGLASTAEIPQITAIALPTGSDVFDPSLRFDCRLVYSDSGASTYYLYVDGDHIVFVPVTGLWVKLSTESNAIYNPTTCYLKGQTYLFHQDSGVSVFESDFTSLVAKSLVGVVAASLLGITSTNNYLIAWDSTTVYWSSPTDPLEFRPSVSQVNTGAGSASVQAVRGDILQCLSTSDGIIIYTTVNAVSMTFSGNSANPWVWREIRNSAGVMDSEHVSAESNTQVHFAWTNAGLQRMDASNATIVFPEISDFLSGDTFERLGLTDNQIESVRATTIAVKVALVSSRYLCLSYGDWNKKKEFVLLYDLALERWGRLKTGHLDIFPFSDPLMVNDIPYSEITETYEELVNVKIKSYFVTNKKASITPSSLGVLKPNGAIHKIELARNDDVGRLEDQASNGELLLGEIKLTRSRQCAITELLIKGEIGEAAVTIETESTYGTVPLVPTPDPKILGKFYAMNSGDSHKVRINGKFTISNIVLALLQTGYM